MTPPNHSLGQSPKQKRFSLGGFPNARNTMLSVGNTIEAKPAGGEVDLPGCRSEDQMFLRLSSTRSRSAYPRTRLCRKPLEPYSKLPQFRIYAHLTAVALFQVPIKSEWRYLRRLNGSQ